MSAGFPARFARRAWATSPFSGEPINGALCLLLLFSLALGAPGCASLEKGYDSVVKAFSSGKKSPGTDKNAPSPEQEQKSVAAQETEGAKASLGEDGSTPGKGAALDEKNAPQAPAGLAQEESLGAKQSLGEISAQAASDGAALPVSPASPHSQPAAKSRGNSYLQRTYDYLAGWFGGAPGPTDQGPAPEEGTQAPAAQPQTSQGQAEAGPGPAADSGEAPAAAPTGAALAAAPAKGQETSRPQGATAAPKAAADKTPSGDEQAPADEQAQGTAAAPPAYTDPPALAQEDAVSAEEASAQNLSGDPAKAFSQDSPPQEGEGKTADGKEAQVRYDLNLQHVDIGMPLNQFGKNLAVIPARDGHRCIGLNGVNASEAFFPGKNFKNFQLDAKIDFNFPIHEGGKVSAELLSLRLGASARRKLMASITQGEAEPPMVTFSLGGPKLAPDMYCAEKPVRWKEDMPDAVTTLTVKKEAGSLRFEYDGELACISPLDPSLPFRDFSTTLGAETLVYGLSLAKLPDSDIPGVPNKLANLVSSEDMDGQPFPAKDTAHQAGVTSIDLSRMSSGTPIGKFGQNLIVLSDEEGKYAASASPQGSNVLFPAQAGDDFSVDILIKNAFDLSEREGRTDRFFLFTVNYKNGVKEVYTINLTRDDQYVWHSRFFISRSGPNVMAWTTATDYRQWNNSLDFNEYKMIKEKGLVRFFFNGEFIRNEPSKGDVFESVKVNLRDKERLYDVIVRDLATVGKTPEKRPLVKERKLQDSLEKDTPKAAPPKGEDNG